MPNFLKCQDTSGTSSKLCLQNQTVCFTTVQSDKEIFHIKTVGPVCSPLLPCALQSVANNILLFI